MKKNFFFWMIFLFSSCSYEAIPDSESFESGRQENAARFSGKDFRYLAFREANPRIDLKSRGISYSSQQSQFHLTELSAKIKSGEQDTALVSERGIHYLENGNFEFAGMVKIVLEKKYLLEGSLFRWDESQRSLKSETGMTVTIRDSEGLMMEGRNFFADSENSSFTLEAPMIHIPDKMAEDEGLN